MLKGSSCLCEVRLGRVASKTGDAGNAQLDELAARAQHLATLYLASLAPAASFSGPRAGLSADGVAFVGGPLPDFLFAASAPALFHLSDFCPEVAGLRGGVPPLSEEQ